MVLPNALLVTGCGKDVKAKRLLHPDAGRSTIVESHSSCACLRSDYSCQARTATAVVDLDDGVTSIQAGYVVLFSALLELLGGTSSEQAKPKELQSGGPQRLPTLLLSQLSQGGRSRPATCARCRQGN